MVGTWHLESEEPPPSSVLRGCWCLVLSHNCDNDDLLNVLDPWELHGVLNAEAQEPVVASPQERLRSCQCTGLMRSSRPSVEEQADVMCHKRTRTR